MENQELVNEDISPPIGIVETEPQETQALQEPQEPQEPQAPEAQQEPQEPQEPQAQQEPQEPQAPEAQQEPKESQAPQAQQPLQEPQEPTDHSQTTELNEPVKSDEKLSENHDNTNESQTAEIKDLDTEISAFNYSKDECVFILSDGFARENDFFQTNNQLSFREEVKLECFCERCNWILWNPVKLNCGHIVCYTCQPFPDSLQNDGVLNCPIDNEAIKQDEIEECENYKNNIWNLQVYCSTALCSWFGFFRDFRSHSETCEFKQTKCPQCDEMIPWRNFETHKLNTCQMRLVLCEFCSNPILFINADSHETQCDDKLIECTNNCKLPTDKQKTMILKQGTLKFHLENACSERRVPCPFEMFGCNKKSKQKKMHHHLTKYAIIHLDAVCSYGKKNTDSLEKQIRTILELKGKLEKNDRKIKILNSEFGTQLLWRIDNINEKYQMALVGANEEIVSNPFYSTAPYGYKFIMRLVFNVQNAKLTSQYLSLFISICDSPYNILLPWPFKLKFNIHIINQMSDKHISHSFLPNPIVENYPFLNQPKTERNPFFGIEKFANCNIFHDNSPFMVDNSMFIKILIEPHGIV